MERMRSMTRASSSRFFFSASTRRCSSSGEAMEVSTPSMLMSVMPTNQDMNP